MKTSILMKIGIAQVRPLKGDIPGNIARHQRMIELASVLQASAVFFPELSLTGYEPELAKDLAATPDDSRFDVFQQIADRYNMTIGVGLPTRIETGICISMVIFQPGSLRQTYSKQQLHADELPYFVLGEEQLILSVGNAKLAPAICYESLQDSHAHQAFQLGAEIYVASVAKSQGGVSKAMAHYPAVARKYAMPVLMANCIGDCDTFESAGQSAVWTKKGVLLAQLDGKSEGMLVFDTETEKAVAQPL